MKKREKDFELVSVSAALRIHNPSQRRRRMLNDAMRRAHLAYTKALDILLPQIGEMDGMNAEEIAHQFAMPKLKPMRELSSAAKAGVSLHIGATLSSFRELLQEQENAGEPTARRLKEEDRIAAHQAALARLALATTKEEAREADADSHRATARVVNPKKGRPLPLHFVRNDPRSGFLILRDEKTRRYYAYLNLHPAKSRFARPVRVEGLVNLRDGKPVSFNNATGDIFPLAFGREQQRDRFLLIERGDSRLVPKSAKLVLRDDDEFDLMVSFEVRVRKRQTRTLLGVDRGINKLVAVCVVDENGAVLKTGEVDGGDLRTLQKREEEKQRETQRRGKLYTSRLRAAESEQFSHRAANLVVQLAGQFAAQVVTENLSGFAKGAPRKKGMRRSNFRRMMGRRQFQKVARAMEYKLRLKGLPAPKGIAAKDTSITCPECGYCNKKNRPEPGDDFACVQCGHKADGDLNAARVIALKRFWRYNSVPPNLRKVKAGALSKKGHGFGDFLRKLRGKRQDGA